MTTAVYPGSFDPLTLGHLNIIERAQKLFGSLDVVIAVNREKKYLFSDKERFEIMSQLVKPWKNITVHLCDKLIVDYAKENGANVLVRGIRNFTDFTYEFDLSLLNKGLNQDIETMFLPTDPDFFVLKSSTIKELAAFNGDISKMVPPLVAEEIKKKYNIMTKLQKV